MKNLLFIICLIIPGYTQSLCLANDYASLGAESNVETEFAYGCKCNKEVSTDYALFNAECPYCRSIDLKKYTKFKHRAIHWALRRGPLFRAVLIVMTGGSVDEVTLQDPLVLNVLADNPELVDQLNIDHLILFKGLRYWGKSVDCKSLKEKISPQELANFINRDIRAFYYLRLKSYVNKFNSREKIEFSSLLIEMQALQNDSLVDALEILRDSKIDYHICPNLYQAFLLSCSRNGNRAITSLTRNYANDLAKNNNEVKKYLTLNSLSQVKRFLDISSLEECPIALKEIQKLLFSNNSKYALETLKECNLTLPKDNRGNTLQMRAAMLDKIELLKQIPNDQSLNKEGLNSLSWSILTNSKQAFKHLLPDSNIEEFDNNGRTPLMLSLQANNFYMTYQLLKNGANVKARDFDGNNCDDYVKTKSKSIKAIFKLMTLKRNIYDNIDRYKNSLSENIKYYREYYNV